MGSEYVTWILPFMVLEFGFVYAVILGIGAVYGLIKNRKFPEFLRDIVIIGFIIACVHWGIQSGHSVMGLFGMGIGSVLSAWIHSSEFSKTNDMAPFGHMTALSMITSLVVIGGILTSELK